MTPLHLPRATNIPSPQFHGFWSSPPPPLYTATTPFAEMAAGAVSDEYGVGHAGAKASFFGFSSKMRLYRWSSWFGGIGIQGSSLKRSGDVLAGGRDRCSTRAQDRDAKAAASSASRRRERTIDIFFLEVRFTFQVAQDTRPTSLCSARTSGRAAHSMSVPAHPKWERHVSSSASHHGRPYLFNVDTGASYWDDDLENAARSSDRKAVKNALKVDGFLLELAQEHMRSDRGLVMTAVKQAGDALMYASADLRADWNVCLAAAKSSALALEYAAVPLLADKDFVMSCVLVNGYSLRFAAEPLRNDREVALEAVRDNGAALEFVGAELRRSKDFMVEALRINGTARQYSETQTSPYS